MLRWMLALVAAAATMTGCSSARNTEGTTPDPLAQCTGCHGNPANGNAAPPIAVTGGSDTTLVTVGAHQAHLKPSAIRLAVDCSECHVVPATVDEPGHIDQTTATLTWGPTASAGGVLPAYQRSADGTSATCTTYCHGASFAAGNGTVHAPIWTKVDGSQAGCGTCHGIPPPAPHPAAPSATACAQCHPDTMNADGTIKVDGQRHINGMVDVIGGGNCSACHGDASRGNTLNASAPPKDTKGNTATTTAGVGAHQAHLTGTNLAAKPVGCSDCHRVPTSLDHATQPLDLTWGALARTEGVTPTFDATALTCTNYCHGASLTGGTKTAPKWTGGAPEAACGSCHGLPPTSGKHAISQHAPFALSCASCHGAGYAVTGSPAVQKALHVNGKRDVSVSAPITTWDPATKNCTAMCHTNQTLVRTW